MFKIESTSIVLNRSRIRFSDIQLKEIANNSNFTGQHHTVIDIQPLLLFLLFYAIMGSSFTPLSKSLLITPPPLEVERHQLSVSTQSSISLGKTFRRVSARRRKLAQSRGIYEVICIIIFFLCQILDFIYSSIKSFIFLGIIYSHLRFLQTAS